jgi:SAM-dependent methyltransferase
MWLSSEETDMTEQESKRTALRSSLRLAYDQRVHERDRWPIAPWKVEVRQGFLALLQAEQKQTLLEIGAGPGRDSLFFQEHGLDVIATDLSPEMVVSCQAKGLNAEVMDMADLSIEPSSLDAVYAVNSLLHLPKSELPSVLDGIHSMLAPEGLFYLGVNGGLDFEGVWEKDFYRPQRFFSFHTDQAMVRILALHFEVVSFDAIDTKEEDNELHFQAVVLRQRTG